MLQITVGGEGEAFLCATGGVKANEVAGNVLELALSALLHAVPSARTQFVEARLFALFAAVFRQFVQCVNRHEYHIVVQIAYFDAFLRGAVHRGFHQAAEAPHAVVHVHHIVAHLNLVEFLERQCQFAAASAVAFEVVFVETVENLMVGEYAQLQVVVHEALVDGFQHRGESDVVAAVVEDGFEAFNLLAAVGEDEQAVAIGKELLERAADEVEILVVDALRSAVQRHSLGTLFGGCFALPIYQLRESGKLLGKLVGVDHLGHGFRVVVVGNKCAVRDVFFANFFHSGEQPLRVVAQQHGIGANEVE